MTTVIDGNSVAAEIRTSLSAEIDRLKTDNITPGLATVLMSADPASETYVSMKQRACEEVGINGVHIEIPADAPASELYETIEKLNADDDIHGILVQMPVPDHVDETRVLSQIDPMKDVDGFHPENVGRLVAGNSRFRPCTPHGVQKLLESESIETEGKDVVIVGRSNIVGKPLANLLVQKAPDGNATVTICHSRTENLAAKTRNADILIAAVGVPEFIDGEMIGEGATVIDVGVNRVEADTEKGYALVGDVEYESAKEQANAITPVPGGVGPMTIAMLLYNTVQAAGLQHDIDLQID